MNDASLVAGRSVARLRDAFKGRDHLWTGCTPALDIFSTFGRSDCALGSITLSVLKIILSEAVDRR